MKKGHSITGEQFEVLVVLWNEDGKNQQRLSKALCKDKTTITRLIKSLEELNLVKRVTNRKDKRQKLVYLTRSGKKTIKKLN
jgi:DNA-binding MarR family transcriptional regulator